jgi:hypothetical protein
LVVKLLKSSSLNGKKKEKSMLAFFEKKLFDERDIKPTFESYRFLLNYNNVLMDSIVWRQMG